MKGYKGFEKGLVCRGKQYAENTVFEEENAEICKSGMHFCALPHHVFVHYSPGENHEFAEVEALDDPKTDDGRKYCTKKLRIGAKISVFDMVKASVGAFFESVNFAGKISETEESDCAANAGFCGAANAGDGGAANAGNYGAANAGYCGAAIAREEGRASVGLNGIAAVIGNGGKVSGKLGAILLLVDTDDYGNTLAFAAVKVDGETIKENTWYKLDCGNVVEVPDNA